ncbi:TolC family protein [Rosistilla carotiformis]|uniref:TolC family protein n=1 Tax=Rosistilla carotiformis TaxID=2528017 RepID=UPI0018D205FB|nr:TolC family protein [Rosistilla carotiformis]
MPRLNATSVATARQPITARTSQMLAAWASDAVEVSGSLEPSTLPADVGPIEWWIPGTARPLRSAPAALPIDLMTLFEWTVQHSARVQAVAQAPWISGTQIEQARGVFDPRIYSDSDYNSSSDPVENILTTGGPPRLEDQLLGTEVGVRGQTSSGGSYGIGQGLGHKNSNSTFFLPNNQGSAGLFANWSQPLLQGRSIDANRSLILTAQFDTAAAQAKYTDAILTQLFDVANGYWSLYVERANLLLRQRHLERAQRIAVQLEHRQSLDAVRSQVLRAQAAVANRRAELSLAEANIKNEESRLRALVNAPAFSDQGHAELLPVQPAVISPIDFDIESEVALAINRRPEILELHELVNATQVRLNLAQDQTRPQLNLVLQGQLAGRQGASDIVGAWSNQFTEGRPGVGGGLQYQLPYRNRTAHGQVRQRQYELTQLTMLIREKSANIRAEVEIAVRNLRASHAAAISRRESLAAVHAELAYLEDRWQLLGNDPRLGQLQLDDLLNGQDRLLREEQALLQSITQYNRSLIEVQRATGALVYFSDAVAN